MRRTFARPVALPVYLGDERKQFDVWANGCIEFRRVYDGQTNKVEIVPLCGSPEWVGPPMWEIGQGYTIGERHLTRLILEGLYSDRATI